VAVDTNVERVIARLKGLKRESRAAVPRHALELMPTSHPGDFVQAMMDLGATICRPKNPRCTDCPLASDCSAFASGEPEAYPEARARAVRPHRHGIAYWIEQGGSVWLVRRPPKGLLGGMAALPGTEWSETSPGRVNALGTVRHLFTHFSLELHILPWAEPIGEGWWQPLEQISEAGLPTVYRKIIEEALTHNDRLAA
jgi:A/G-specific adenine glycosylase